MLARLVEQAGASAVAVHGRTAAQAYHGHADWDLIAQVAAAVSIPVYGCGDLREPGQIVERLRDGSVAGVLVGRGILRNPWLFAQADDLLAGRPMREITPDERAHFLLEYMDLLIHERVDEPRGFRHLLGSRPRLANASGESGGGVPAPAERGRERWVINKLRALSAWYTKGFENGSHVRIAVNRAESLDALRRLIEDIPCLSTNSSAEAVTGRPPL